MNARTIMRTCYELFLRIRRNLELRGYDDFTIENYFRKQGFQIGENNQILVRGLTSEPYLVKIGSHCLISSKVLFHNHDGGPHIFRQQLPSLQRFGTIVIHDNCFIGFGATIMLNISIGPNSIVGACSVVTKDVPPNTIVAGNPARVVSSIDRYKEKVLATWKKQKPPNYLAEFKDGVVYSPAQIERAKRRDYQLLKKHLMETCWSDVQAERAENTGEGLS